MDFKTWQSTRANSELSDYTYVDGDYGFVYHDGSFIQELEDGRFWTIVCQEDKCFSFLAEAEEWLWEKWAKDSYNG